MTDKILRATHSSVVKIGNFEIPCHVLEDGGRILSTRGIMKSLGRTWRGRKYSGTQYPVFLEAKNLNEFISNDLATVSNPIRFYPKTGYLSEGYNAEILPIVCETYLKARDAGALTQQQMNIAHNCDILIRGLSRVGIIALIDEATGYQEVRDKLALQKILELYIAKELRPWIKTFPDEFYENLFRLRGWQYKPLSVKRPIVVGKITNDLIYKRLAPGILKELREITPRDEKGRTKHRYFQRLTENLGHPKLREHLASVTTLLKASPNWAIFYRLIQRALPQYGETLELPLSDKEIEKMEIKEEEQTQQSLQ